MSEQENQQRQEVPFAAAKASAARSAILRSSAELLTWRARVEKYLQADPQRARGCYEELQKVRTRLAAALGDARLALLELEEYAGAGIAGKLQAGLSGFNLMSRAYKPVYEALHGFAEKLPERPDTVNAKTIGRLMTRCAWDTIHRSGEHRTYPAGHPVPGGRHYQCLRPLLRLWQGLAQIAQGNNCFAYGVELDESRAEEAQTRLHRVGVGSFFHSRISSEAFHLLFLNPPYLSVLNQGGGRARHEKRLLVESMGHLMLGGLLIYVIPYYRLTRTSAASWVKTSTASPCGALPTGSFRDSSRSRYLACAKNDRRPRMPARRWSGTPTPPSCPASRSWRRGATPSPPSTRRWRSSRGNGSTRRNWSANSPNRTASAG